MSRFACGSGTESEPSDRRWICEASRFRPYFAPCCSTMFSQVPSVNWYRPVALLVAAFASGSKLLSWAAFTMR